MRTTLDVADDVLLAAKETARRRKTSIGAVISDLARKGLTVADAANASSGTARASRARPSPLAALGIQPLPRRGGVISNELINRLRDDGAY